MQTFNINGDCWSDREIFIIYAFDVQRKRALLLEVQNGIFLHHDVEAPHREWHLGFGHHAFLNVILRVINLWIIKQIQIKTTLILYIFRL